MLYTEQAIEFLRGDGKNASGYTLEDILLWDDDSWEMEHDFIQWLFPTDRESSFNPDAPVLDGDAVHEMRGSVEIRGNLLNAYERFLGFVGLTRGPEGLCGVDSKLEEPNHNWLRVGRVIRSLKLLGCEQSAVELFDFVSKLENVDSWTLDFWNDSIRLR